MPTRLYTISFPALLLTLLWTGSLAHHSVAAFDIDKKLVVSGEILRFDWTNPHTRVSLQVVGPDGSAVVWDLEGMAPDYLGRRGWTRSTIRPGEIMSVTIHPLNSDSGKCFS